MAEQRHAVVPIADLAEHHRRQEHEIAVAAIGKTRVRSRPAGTSSGPVQVAAR